MKTALIVIALTIICTRNSYAQACTAVTISPFTHKLDCITQGQAPVSASFTTATSVAINHNLNTYNLLYGCYTNATPPVQITVTSLTYTDANNVTLGFGNSTGTCFVNGGVGPTGSAGPTGATGAQGNTILHGSGAPGNGSGLNGDFYIDTAATCLYGPKAAGAWPGSCQSLLGSTGTTGATGATGPPGNTGSQGPPGPLGSPATTTDRCVPRWNGTTGTALLDSGVCVTDAGAANAPGGFTGNGGITSEFLLPALTANGTAYASFVGIDNRTTTVRLQIPDGNPTVDSVIAFGVPDATTHIAVGRYLTKGTDYYGMGTPISAGDLPFPAPTALGGVKSGTCAAGLVQGGINTDGTINCIPDPGGTGGGGTGNGQVSYGQPPTFTMEPRFPTAFQIQNSVSTAPILYRLAKLSGGTATVMGTGDTTGFMGICVYNCNIYGVGWFVNTGPVPIQMDGSSTVDHYVTISSGTAGEGHDTGSTSFPGSGMVIGRVYIGNAGGAGSIAYVVLSSEIFGH